MEDIFYTSLRHRKYSFFLYILYVFCRCRVCRECMSVDVCGGDYVGVSILLLEIVSYVRLEKKGVRIFLDSDRYVNF